jgi:hypothetical protein
MRIAVAGFCLPFKKARNLSLSTVRRLIATRVSRSISVATHFINPFVVLPEQERRANVTCQKKAMRQLSKLKHSNFKTTINFKIRCKQIFILIAVQA